MTHNDLISEIAKRLNWTDESVAESIDAFAEIIGEQLINGNNVSIQDFGSFELNKTAEYILVDSDADKKWLIPPKIDVSFKPSTYIKEKFSKLKDI